MFNFLNRLGLPVKYAILSFSGALLGVFLAKTFGYSGMINYISTPIAAAIGGAIGGWLRQRKGRVN